MMASGTQSYRAGSGGCDAATAACGTGAPSAVLVLEREHSAGITRRIAVPFTFQPARTARLIERMRQSHYQKKSASCLQTERESSQPFYFSTLRRDTVAQTWQVLRRNSI